MDSLLRFCVDGEHYILVEDQHAEFPANDFQRLGTWEAELVLTRALADAGTRGLLRAGLAGGHASDWDDHHRFSERLRARLGEDRRHLVLLRRYKPQRALVFTEPDQEIDDLSGLAPADAPEDTWFEVQVLDDDDEPVAGIEYEVELSDGRVRRGRTSEFGILRYDGMPPGSCNVRLLSVDAKSWDVA